MTLVDQSPYRSAQASYQLDMATPIYAQKRRRSAAPVFGMSPERQTESIKDRRDYSRVALAAVVAAGLGAGLAAAFLRRAERTRAHRPHLRNA